MLPLFYLKLCMKSAFLFCIIAPALIFSCNKSRLFDAVPPGHSGIDFSNTIMENDSINILDYEYVYNGGGVGIGDFNKDGLPDIYFTGNMVSNRLYLNKGDMKFTDVTQEAGTGGEGKWCNGVSVVDINNDGWPDIFVSATRSSDANRRKKLLYINQGLDKNGVPVFKDEAAEYGLDDTSYTTNAVFFDYDNDGDLDMFLLVAGKMQGSRNPNVFLYNMNDSSAYNTSKLFQNNWDNNRKHPYFTDVSRAAGINKQGFGLGVNITDINKDGWKDIFVSNDYLSNDLLWINNHDGTFTDRSKDYFKHTSFSSMGNDVQDLNNDGLCDVIELDMNPADNYRKKMMLNPNNYHVYQNFDLYNYQYEYPRNTLQINQGNSVGRNDSVLSPVFSELSYLTGLDKTDWSWTPLVADFDNDAYRDIIVTNGFPKDLSDHDFIAFRDKSSGIASKEMIMEKLPVAKLKNYAYHNNGGLSFSDVSQAWGIDALSFSNGAAYADFDNDGDLDVVINNINDKAMLFKNMAVETKKEAAHYLHINFSSEAPNVNGVGAWAELHYSHGKQQVFENTPYRGYLSTDQAGAHFGLGDVTSIDTLIIKWPDGKLQLLKNVKTNQVLTVKHSDAHEAYTWYNPVIATHTLFKEISDSIKANIVHKEDDYIDFNIQKLLPHKLSDYGPGLAAGDINGDGLDDIIMAGSAGYSTQVLTQQANGAFVTKPLLPNTTRTGKTGNDMGVLLFDADGDGDADLYITTGGYNNSANSPAYADKLYINDGKGNFRYDSTAIPVNYASKSCARAVDYDNDGDLDLFVAGRCMPGKYPQAVSCSIYRNDSKDGKIIFTDVTNTVAKGLQNVGMSCDVLWTDFDNDGWTDLIIAGEFMPIKFFKNNHGKLELLQTSMDKATGWWNSIIPGDFDNDGDMDYIVGNAGQNSFYRPTEKYPVRVYAKDFDNNGIYDALPTMYLPTSQQDTTMREFPAQLRDDEIKQMVEFRRKFPDYKSYANATIDKLLTPDELKGALILEANTFKSCYIRNDGNGKFTMIPLPIEAQLSSLFGMVAEDVDGDGNLDVVISGNDYGTEVSVGRYDALNGLVLKGDGKGGFTPLTILQSGINIPGNGKSLVKFSNKNGRCLLAAAQNRGAMKVFLLKENIQKISVQPGDVFAMLKLKNGKIRKVELNYGAGFLSQSSRFLNIDAHVQSIEIVNGKGERRKVL